MDASTLRRSPVFARVPDEALDALATALIERAVPAGATVWQEGRPSDELALVVSGALQARVGVQEVGLIRAGELVGEAGTFFADPRAASVVATEPSTLAFLSRHSLLTLRGAQPAVYDALLERALTGMARRVQDTARRVAMLGNGGVEPPVRKPPSVLTRLLRVGAPSAEVPSVPVLPALRRLPLLARAPSADVSRLGAAFTPRKLQLDEILVLEGEAGDSAFLIGEGEVEVLRAVRGGRARVLARLTEGAIIGTGALLLGERRNASLKVTRPGWAWELERAAHAALGGEAGRMWREAVLVALRSQLEGTSATLADLQGGTSPADLRRLREAAARLTVVRPQDVDDDPWTYLGKARP